jgi:hypothetical protein
MPRWPVGHVTKRTCPQCGGRKDFHAAACRSCTEYPKPLLGCKGSAHPTWKGGFRVDRDGYIRTYAPDHPWPRKSGYVLEHVRVMELSMGRRIKPGEIVHHKDGDKRNNHPANLDLMTAGAHSKYHRKRDTHKRQRVSGRFA